MRNCGKSTGLSLAIRKTFFDFKLGAAKEKKLLPSEFTIKIANTLEERESVFHLAYQIYLEKGFIKKRYQEWLIQDYDSHPETVVLIVQDRNKKIAGSLTLVFGEEVTLPSEKIYGQEINALIIEDKKIVEISRLVVSHEYRNSKDVLLLLINYLMIYTYHVKNYSFIVIQVNPRHKTYYKTLLNFEEIGLEKGCPSVQNAPAVLLSLPISKYQSEVNRFATLQNQNKKERSLYAHFLNPEQERLVAHYLQNQINPMNANEKIYFGFSESGLNRTVCI